MTIKHFENKAIQPPLCADIIQYFHIKNPVKVLELTHSKWFKALEPLETQAGDGSEKES